MLLLLSAQSVAWDNFCSWCDASRCIPNTADYTDGDIVDSAGGNCFVDDSECQVYPSEGGGLATTELCELTVRPAPLAASLAAPSAYNFYV